MGRGRGIPRSVRLAQIQSFLHGNPAGLTTRELAGLCGVCSRTIQRDLLDLQSELHAPVTQKGDRYSLMGGYLLPPVSFSLHEAVAVFLAGRLALRQTDEDNSHVQQALTKLAATLPSPLNEQLVSGVRSIARKASNPDFVRVFEQVATAWVTRRRLKIKYCSLHSDADKEWLLEPYCMEMTGAGYSMYVIGHAVREGKEGLITFKLDRIRAAVLLEERFELPMDFDIGRVLSSSWGVMWGEETEVKLKFSSGVARRVKESVWHPTQQIADLPDGGCLFTARVSNLLEMTPWIRGWGPDVEVLEPEGLRMEMAESARRSFEIYQQIVKVEENRCRL